MYYGVTNSPATIIVKPINETETTIVVENIDVLPDGPNIAVIGIDENAETIIYSGKSGNMLTGVQRGVEGVAKSWNVDEEIRRNFTNKDYRTLIENINKINLQLENMESSMSSNNEELTGHKENVLPHKFKSGTTNFSYGFRVDESNSLILMYKEDL